MAGHSVSQPTVKSVVCSHVTAADLLDGAVTLYTPSAGELVVALFVKDFTLSGGTGGIAVGAAGVFGSPSLLLGGVDSSIAYDSSLFSSILNSATPVLSEPVLAAACFDVGTRGVAFSRPWQSATAYDINPDVWNLIEAGHFWLNSGSAGVSGNVKPDFASNIGGSVADGANIVWQDQGSFSGAALTPILLVAVTP